MSVEAELDGQNVVELSTVGRGDAPVTADAPLLGHLLLDVGVLIHHCEGHLPLWAGPLQMLVDKSWTKSPKRLFISVIPALQE